MNGFILKTTSKKRQMFNITKSKNDLKKIIENFPSENDSFRFISFAGGFASISFILIIAEKEIIEELSCSTLRVGNKQLKFLDSIFKKGRLNKCNFIVGTIMKENKKYSYYNDFVNVCIKNKWSYKVINNHSKLILIKTKNNFYVIETSSNLNDNPKIEQFTFLNDEKVYKFYYNIFEMLKNES